MKSMFISSGNAFLDELLEGFNFLDLICKASRLSVYTVLERVGPDNTSEISIGNWAGGKPNKESRAPYVAHCKAGELLWFNKSHGVSITPVPDLDISNNQKGGVRWDDKIVAISKLSQEHDQMLSAVTSYFIHHKNISLHHVGFSCTESEFEDFSKHSNGFEINASDHKRIYIPVIDDRAIFGKYYIEYFYYPGEPYEKSIHWDFVCEGEPSSFLNFISYITEIKVELNNPLVLNQPIGSVWVEDSEGLCMGVMARTSFWEIK